MIKSREDAFFQDAYKSRSLGSQHPLLHLISTYAKLQDVNSISLNDNEMVGLAYSRTPNQGPDMICLRPKRRIHMVLDSRAISRLQRGSMVPCLRSLMSMCLCVCAVGPPACQGRGKPQGGHVVRGLRRDTADQEDAQTQEDGTDTTPRVEQRP